MTSASFIGNQFKRLKFLQLNNVTVPQTQDMSKSLAMPDAGVLTSFHSVLTSLILRNAAISQISAAIGHIRLHELRTLDLSHNPIQNTLNRFSFANVTGLRRLYLADCMIEYIAADTFHFLRRNIELLDLSSNRLQMLPSGFHESMLPKKEGLSIIFDKNPWICNCENATDTYEKILCHENCEVPYRTRAMASKYSRNTYNADEDTVDIECVDYANKDITEIVTVKCRTMNMDITEVGENTLKIVFEQALPNYILMWFNDSMVMSLQDHEISAHDLSCVALVNQTNYIRDLSVDTTYTFCVFENVTSTISPFDCVAYYLPRPENEDDNPIWIAKSQKTMAIFIAIGLFVVFMWCGLLVGIWLIRRNPNWLKGSKNVVVVDSTNAFQDSGNDIRSNNFSIEDNNVVDYR